MAKKLLVVDKDPSVHSFVEKNLPADKFSLTGINDGLSALDMLDKVKPDMILVEFGLDGIDVFRFFEKVKQKNQEKERPIVLTVGPNDPYEPARLLAMGVMAILKKPLDPKQLLEKLQELSEETATLIDRSPAEPSATPPAGAPAAEPAGQNSASGTEAGSMKIEQMLGWSLPGEQSAGSPENDETKTQKRPRPASPEADLE
ncbi:MAG TPA: response regulator, partial [Nitrospiria bacterium]|nr:response regulator [Nitrospiria bacterium]